MLKECGCLPYYYPRLDAILQFQEGFENLTAACTLDGWKCLMSNVDILEAVDPMSHNTGDNVEVQKLTGAKYVPKKFKELMEIVEFPPPPLNFWKASLVLSQEPVTYRVSQKNTLKI